MSKIIRTPLVGPGLGQHTRKARRLASEAFCALFFFEVLEACPERGGIHHLGYLNIQQSSAVVNKVIVK
ncbi:MAG: hypothetical protein WCI18_12345 [Pseudomonadota bacterium]